LTDERDFVLEPLLLAQQGKNVLLQPLSEFRNAVGFQMHINSAREHGLSSILDDEGDLDNYLWLTRFESALSLFTTVS